MASLHPVKNSHKKWPPRVAAYMSCFWAPLSEVSGSATEHPMDAPMHACMSMHAYVGVNEALNLSLHS